MRKRGGVENIRRFIAGTMAAMLALSPTLSDAVQAQTQEHTCQNPEIVEADESSGTIQKVTWDCVWFGEYPQAEVISTAMSGENYTCFKFENLREEDFVIDDSLYEQLCGAEESQWDNNEIVLDGVKYRRAKKDDAVFAIDNDPCFYNWGDMYHYFRYEPIKWRVLQVEGDQAYLLSDICLDSQYYATTLDDWTWEKSQLRSWLNGTEEEGYSGRSFLYAAFDEQERNAIKLSYVENVSNMLQYGTNAGADTWDQIFLLSEAEVHNTDQANAYGLAEGAILKTDFSCYTLAMGAAVYPNSQTNEPNDKTRWWLRSSESEKYFMFIGWGGSILPGIHGLLTLDNVASIRPVLHLDLTETDVYSYAGTVCSDGTKSEVRPGQNSSGDGEVEETPESSETPEKPSETPEESSETPEKPSETPEEPSETPEEPGETPEEPGEIPEPSEIPEEPSETPGESSETPEEPGETPEVPDLVSLLGDPKITADETQTNGQKTVWDCIWFGSYPQAEVVTTQMSKNYQPLGKEYFTESDLIVSDKIYEILQNADGWDENNDLTIAKERYHRIKAADATANTYGGISGRYAWEDENTYHYFQYQPIKWRILNKNGTNILVMADLGLDDQPYHTISAQAEWVESTIRSWLNGYTASSNGAEIDYSGQNNFYNRAFSEKEQAAILITELSGEDEVTTNDKIFLLAQSDVCGTTKAGSYGFANTSYSNDAARGAGTSLYAKAMGAAGGTVTSWIGNSAWWLRTTEKQWNQSYLVNTDGTVGINLSSEKTIAVRPAMIVNLAAAEDCFYAGTISSDGTKQETPYPTTDNEETTAQICLSNPTIEETTDLTSGKKVTWDSVWFGSYPQSEVVTTEMSKQYSEVDSAYRASGDLVVSDRIYAALEQATDWDENGDITINGEKYRRLRQSDVTFSADYISPVSYQWTSGNAYHYFRYEPIKWRVLKVDGAKALLLADEALDAKPFNEDVTINTWKDVTLRSWLNGYGASLNKNGKNFEHNSFIDTAFTEAQQARVFMTELDEADAGISDKVFLLSTTQLTTESYGFVSSYLQKDEARRSGCSLYAKALGASWSDQEGIAGNVCWWRRCTFASDQESSASLVSCMGDVGTGISSSTAAIAVRPAITLDLSVAGTCVYAGTVCSDGSGTEIAYPNESTETQQPEIDMTTIISDPRIVEDSSIEAGQKVTWDTIYFGNYPQAEVITSRMSVNYTAVSPELMNDKDFVVSDKIYSSLQSAVWDDNGDTTIGGVRYRRIRKTDATYAENKKIDSAYYWEDEETYHYFQYQPIKWRVLKVDGNAALLLSDIVLDDQKYHTQSISVKWENSTIRSWLNGYSSASNQAGVDYSSNSFIRTAFDESQQNAIKILDVENKENLTYHTAGGNHTSDRIFLLSESDVYSSAEALGYGFAVSRNAYDEARQTTSSTYAKAMGTSWNTSSTYYGNSWWGLRSPGYNGTLAASVYADGYVCTFGTDVSNGNDGIRAALWLDVSDPSMFSYNGTVSTYGIPSTSKGDETISDPNHGTGDLPQQGSDDNNTGNSQTGNTDNNQTGNTNNNQTGNTGNDQPEGSGNNNTVVTPSKKVTGIYLDGDITKLAAGKKTTLTATVTPLAAANKKLKWSSSNTAYATVSSSGVVTAKAAGAGHTVTITAQSTDGSKVKATYRIKIVKKAVKSLQLTGISKKLAAGKKMTLNASISPAKAGNQTLTWSSSNTKYATVSSKGVVTAKSAGAGKSVTITAATTDGSGLKAVYKIKIMKGAVKSIRLTTSDKQVVAGRQRTVKAKVSTTGATANTKLQWSSSNTKYATVSSKGVVRTKKAGKGHTVTITAKATDGTGKKATIKLRIR